MKQAHFIKLRVFSLQKDKEDDALILDKFKSFVPLDFEKERISIITTSTQGFNEKNIKIFEIDLRKDAHINAFLNHLISVIDKDTKELIVQQLESRLDDHLDFYLRFDKKEWFENSRLQLTDAGNCIHIKITVAAFPKKRENAVALVRKWFE